MAANENPNSNDQTGNITQIPILEENFNFDDVNDIQVYLNHLRTKIPIEEVEGALKNPTIIHNVICFPKLWFTNTRKQSGVSACIRGINCSCKKYFNLWHYFANQTDYYDEIARFTGVKYN